MASVRKIVYVDTNVIIEATRTDCWKALLNRFDIRTVEEVRREALRVPANRAGYVPIDPKPLADHVVVNKVEPAEILRASVMAISLTTLDAGERDLLAHVASLKPEAWILTTADRAAVKAACELRLGPKLVSLEQLASECGKKPKLNDWFTTNWLGRVRTEFLLDGI